MRIWSTNLIKILPNKQLKALRYELGDMIKQYPNIKHPLVKYANNYDILYLYDYFLFTVVAMKDRIINMNEKYNDKIGKICFENSEWDSITYNLQFKEDNQEYLIICLWNLYEKYLRGVITKEEWQKIEDFISKEV